MQVHALTRVAGVVAMLSASADAQEPQRLSPAEARQHVGEEASVCGRVTAYRCEVGRGTMLDLDGPRIDGRFLVVISPSDRAWFGDGFESRLDRRDVCATGRVESVGGEYLLRVSSPDALRVEGQAAPVDPAAVVFTPCDGSVSLPKVIHAEHPQYTSEAMRAGVMGRVVIQGIVAADGNVRDARIVQPLDPSLDKEALRAFNLWRFSPGTRNGAPAPIAVTLDMTFTLK